MNSEHPPAGPPTAAPTPWLSPWLLLAGACLLLGLGGDAARELLRYERDALLSGELWRLVTGHLVHLGWPHLWLNLIALIILGNLFTDVLARSHWWLGLLLSALAIDAGLFLINTAVVWYVGLSGVLHGIMLLGALHLVRQQVFIGVALLLGVLLKVAWEQWQGPLPFTESAAAGPVLVDAHLYGALGGALTFAILWAHRRLQPPPV